MAPLSNRITYPIHQSPLYCLSSKRQLAALLRAPLAHLKHLTSDTNYYQFEQRSKTITAPEQDLKRAQKRLLSLLQRIEVPGWLFSGVKGKSYISNARYHLNHRFVIALDISSFYESCRGEKLFRFFRYKLRQENDVARLLSELVTFDNSVPRGSPTSQMLTFFSYQGIFEHIWQWMNAQNIRMSLYVDDMTFSSQRPLPRGLPGFVSKQLQKAGLSINKRKTRTYGPSDFKRVTGCVISPKNELCVPNDLRNKIITELRASRHPKFSPSLIGRINSARQIEPGIFQTLANRYK